MSEPVDPAVQADIQHLLDLLDMLPRFEDTAFWPALDDAVWQNRRYFEEKMWSVPHFLRKILAGEADPTPHELQHLAQYVLMFFDQDNQTMFELLDGAVGYNGGSAGRAGRRWAEDAAATAWRLYVPGAAGIGRNQRQELGAARPWDIPPG